MSVYRCDYGAYREEDYLRCYGELLKFYTGFEEACRHFLGDLDARYFIITYTAIALTAGVGFILYFNKKL